eukprot:8756089-Heterocapsa_arctica.AAC.2
MTIHPRRRSTSGGGCTLHNDANSTAGDALAPDAADDALHEAGGDAAHEQERTQLLPLVTLAVKSGTTHARPLAYRQDVGYGVRERMGGILIAEANRVDACGHAH